MSHSNVCYEFQNKGNCYRKNCKFDHIPASRQAINQPKKEANNPNQSSYFPAAHQSSFSQGARAYPVESFSSSPNPRQSDDRRYNQTQSKTISRTNFRGLPSNDQASKVNSRPNPPDDGINRNVVLVSNNFYNTKPPREDYPETRQVMYTEAIQFNPTVPPPVGKLPPPITTPNCTSVNPNLQRAKAELNKLEKTLEDRSTWMNDPKNTPQDCIQILQEKMNKRQKLMDFIKTIESQGLKEGKCSSQEVFKDTDKASQRVSNFEEKARRGRSRSRDECGTDRKSRKRHRSSSNFTSNSRCRRGSSYSSRDSHSPLKNRRKSSPSRLDRNHSNIKDESPMRRKDESPKRRRRSRSDSRSERNKSLYDRNICQNIKEESPKRRYRSGSESRIERNRNRSDKNCSNIEDGSQKRRHRSGSESRGERNASRLERNNCSNFREENQRSRRDSQSENRRDNCERRLDRSSYSNMKQENRRQHKSPSKIRRASNEGRLNRSNIDNVKLEKPRCRRESQSESKYESNENRLSRNKVSNSNQEMDKSVGQSNIRRDGGESPFQQNFCMNIKQERMNIKQERDFVGPGKKHARIWIPPKHGEPWVCKECGGNTVAWRPKCFHCEAPMPGNWKCMKAKCGTINWKKSMACNTCLRENPNVWICQAEGCGEFNWNTKKVCHTCHKSEGRALPDERGSRGTNRRSRDFNRECKPFRDERNFNERGNPMDLGNDVKRNPDNDRHSFERINSASGSEKLDGDQGGEKDPSYWKRYFEEQKEKNKKENEIQNSKSLEINKRLAMLAGNYLTAEGEPVVVQECDSGEDEIEWLDEIVPTGDCSEGMEVPGPSEEWKFPDPVRSEGNNRSERIRALSPESPWEKIRSPKRGTKTREEICIDVSDSEDEPNDDVVFERGELSLIKTQKKTSALGEELGSASDKRKDPIQIERGVRENNPNMISSPSKRASDVLKSPAKRVHVIASPPIRVSEESPSPRVSNPPTRVSDAGSKPSERATDIVTSQGSPVCIDLDEEDAEQLLLGPASPDPNISRRKANSIGETLQREKDKQSLENSQLGLKNLESSSSTCKDGSMIEKPTRDKLKQSLDLSTLGPTSLEQNKSSHTVSSREEKSRGKKPKQTSEASPQDPQLGQKSSPLDPEQGKKASPPDPQQGQKKKLKLSDYKLRKKASEENHCNASSSKSSQDSIHIKDAASSATNTQEYSNNRKPPDTQTIHEDDDIVVIQSKDKH